MTEMDRSSTLVMLILGVLAVNAQQHCPANAIYNANYNRCYQYFTTPVEFLLADQNCAGLGGHLASIADGQENLLINTNAVQAFHGPTDYWIGANDLMNPGQWRWTDGNTFGYTNWATGEPKTGSDCGAQQVADAKWITADCTAPKAYVCVLPTMITSTCPPPVTQIPVTCPTFPPITAPVCASSCEIEWAYFPPTDMCYKTFFNSKYEDAEAFCISQHAHLVSIHSAIENSFVNNIARTGIKEGRPVDLAWIGLHKNGSEWIWTDGTPTDFLNWAPKKPDEPTKPNNCVQTAPDRSKDKWYEVWNNLDCSTEMRAFICKKASIH